MLLLIHSPDAQVAWLTPQADGGLVGGGSSGEKNEFKKMFTIETIFYGGLFLSNKL